MPGKSWNHHGRESSIVAEIVDSTRDTGTEAGETVLETWRDKIKGPVQDLVVDEVVTLVEEMEITMEAEVHQGAMATTQTPPPQQDAKKMRGGGQNYREGGRSAKRERLIWDMGKIYL